MSLPFTNTHMHVFNSACAPDRFLMIIPMKLLRAHPARIKRLIDTGAGRFIIHSLFKLRNSTAQKKLDKYLAFLDVGTDATQQQVFETALQVGKAADPSVRIVGLSLNMDFMDSEASQHQISFETQLEGVKAIKRYYPANFFPFLGIDPRDRTGANLRDWSKKYFESGVVTNEGKVYPYFCGIKLYPALGFFPFDPRLDELYQYATDNNLPVMTHCTRSGSQYIGNQIESLIPRNPAMIMPSGPADVFSTTARQNIYSRIDRYYNHQPVWIKNSDVGANDYACDLFGHPENYIPLLEKYSKLRICLAHMGGSDEIPQTPPSNDQDEIQRVDGFNWFRKIKEMMKVHLNLYTDISYTLSDLDIPDRLTEIESFLNEPDAKGNPLSARVLFGTDFFMTEQEKHESKLYELAAVKLGPWMDQISRKNPYTFLMQPV